MQQGFVEAGKSITAFATSTLQTKHGVQGTRVSDTNSRCVVSFDRSSVTTFAAK